MFQSVSRSFVFVDFATSMIRRWVPLNSYHSQGRGGGIPWHMVPQREAPEYLNRSGSKAAREKSLTQPHCGFCVKEHARRGKEAYD